MFWKECEDTNSQVPFLIKSIDSSFMAIRHWGSFNAWKTQEGSREEGKGCLVVLLIRLGLKILFWERVLMEWVRNEMEGGEDDCERVRGKEQGSVGKVGRAKVELK